MNQEELLDRFSLHYERLIFKFANSINKLDYRGMPEPHIPVIGSCYSKCKYKIAFYGIETAWWHEMEEFMKKAKENGVEIRLYESQEYTHDDMECLRVIAEGELDFLNQEWVINWNETDLIDYVNGDREPNYLYLVKAILADCERELSSNKEVKELLTAYPNTEYKEDIEIALLRAMQEYIKDIM